MTESADIDIEPESTTNESLLREKRIAFVGKLGGVNRKEAQQIVKRHGGIVATIGEPLDWIVVGADELPLGPDETDLLSQEIRDAAAKGELEILSETEFWSRLGLVDGEQHIRRLYTPSMLAQLLNVSVGTVRGWHRRGLITAAREVKKLPYFDFQEVASARRLAELVAAGASPAAIEKKLTELSRYVPDIDRPLSQLGVIVEGQQLLLRQGEGLIEPGGQLRLNFDSVDEASNHSSDQSDALHSGQVGEDVEAANLVFPPTESLATPADLLAASAQCEEHGALPEAIELCRAALAAGGPSAEACFQLAELLYRQGDLSGARERYYTAIEIDEDYVEARANLGCVLADLGETELAIASFQGALRYHHDYPDVHFHLATALDSLERPREAEEHWQEFLKLAPESPWADEARDRLGEEIKG